MNKPTLRLLKRGDLTKVAMTRVLAALCALAIALALPAGATTSTRVAIFNPWASTELRHGFVVSGNVKGACGMHSLVSQRPDAWRCYADDDMYDPCFARSSHTYTVACAEGPFSKRITLMTVTAPLTDTVILTGKLWGLRLRGGPWGLRLVSGDTCVFAQGATDAVAGERLNYACRKTGWIIGVPDRLAPIWTARTVEWPNKHVTKVSIATAVF
jgi:hypothetical protein